MTTLTTEFITEWAKECPRHVVNTTRLLMPILQERGIDSVRVVDVGANIGSFVDILSDSHAIERAAFIEPVPELAAVCKQKYPMHIHIDCAAGDTFEDVNLYVTKSDNLGLSRIVNAYSAIDSDRILHIKSLPITHILEVIIDFTPNVIKIDAEGYDIRILKNLLHYIKKLDKSSYPIIIFETTIDRFIGDVIHEYNEIGFTLTGLYEGFNSGDLYLIPN